MCGIAGLLLDDITPRAGDWLTDMTQSLYHRGPDAGGAVVFGMNGSPVVTRGLGRPGEPVEWSYLPAKAGLGARRLAVIDLSPAGHQPMPDAAASTWLVFNGEIYNHAALRRELEAHGRIFRGRSDTEVVLAAWRVWGEACFARFEGMWALAILDWPARRMALSRDRLGIKPLYLSRFDGGLAFASEIKSLLALPGAHRGANEARLRDFLVEGLVDHTDDTLFEGIWSLPAGCWMDLDLRGKGEIHAGGAVRRYWRPTFDVTPFEDAAGLVRETLSAAVASHSAADVAVGSCLSGGIDSSGIVAMIHRLRSTPGAPAQLTQHTFTTSLPGTDLDERRHAEAVIAACRGLEPHFVEPSAPALLAAMPSLMHHQEQPFGSPSIYLQWEVMKAARAAGMTVLLDGQGGDELFCGYEGLIPAFIAVLLRQARLARARAEYREGSRFFPGGALKKHVAAAAMPASLRDSLRRRHQAATQPWLARELFDAQPPPRLYDVLRLSPPPPLDDLAADPFVRRAWSLVLSDSLPSLLRFEDRNSMAFSIEARVPYLDRAVVELAMAVPPGDKIRNGVLKAVLRDALRGMVPDTVLDRRDKIGFSAPTAAWLRGGLQDWWREALTSKSFIERGCFEPKGVVQLIRQFDEGDEALALPIWRLAITEQWARQFLDGSSH